MGKWRIREKKGLCGCGEEEGEEEKERNNRGKILEESGWEKK